MQHRASDPVFTALEFERLVPEWSDALQSDTLPWIDLSAYRTLTLSGAVMLLTFGFACATAQLTKYSDSLPLRLPTNRRVHDYIRRMRFFTVACFTPHAAFMNAEAYRHGEVTPVFQSVSLTPYMPLSVVVPRDQHKDEFERECGRFVHDLNISFDSALASLGFSADDQAQFWEPNKEIVENIHYHSTSWGFGAIDTTAYGISICYADLGIGIRRSLQPVMSEALSDEDAILLAFRPGVTGKPGESRGLGLALTRAFAVDRAGGTLYCRSGSALVRFRSGQRPACSRVAFLPGVQLLMFLPRRTR